MKRRAKAARLLTALGAAMLLALANDAAAAKPDEQAKQALVLFERGKLAYQEGRYDDSILLLNEAYALKAEPVLLYNVGRAQEAKGALADAITSYEKYLATSGDPPDRVEVEQKIAALRERVAEAERKAVADAAATRASTPPRESTNAAAPADDGGPSLAPWVVAGSGAVVLGVGAVLGVVALGENADADEAPSQREAADAKDGADTFALLSTVTFVVGGVALAGGVTWGLVDLSTSGASPAATATRDGARTRPRARRLALRWVGPGAVVEGDL